jgi:alkylation response protein AidB-like acyl-CoA dehydrogenase
MLRRTAVAAETARRVPDASFEAISEAGIFRMTAPKRYGGDEADFQTQCDVLAEIARGCPSTSWVATIFSAMAWLAGVFPDEAQDEVFENRDPRIGGVFSPTGTAVRKNGGLVVNGRWPFNTGCHGATWTVLNAVLGEVPGVPTCVLVRSSELRVPIQRFQRDIQALANHAIMHPQTTIELYGRVLCGLPPNTPLY